MKSILFDGSFTFASRIRSPSRISPFSVSCFTPLCERLGVHSVSLESLNKWKNEKTKRIEQDSRTYNIPANELKIELRWLLEDVLAATKPIGRSDWNSPIAFHCLNTKISKEKDIECLLRLTLSELDTLWSKRQTERIPIQYLTQTVHWRDVILTVGPGVLIPRPETEQIIDLAETAIQRNPDLANLPWADLGTGSGAIAIGLALLFKRFGGNGKILAVDKSSTCLRCARRNLERLGLEDNVQLFQGDWLEPVSQWKSHLGGIVSNPPYIPSSDVLSLQPEVRFHEPREALDGGSDGMESIARLTRSAGAYLISSGVFILETNGYQQTHFTKQVLQTASSPDHHFQNIEMHFDDFGIRRFVTATNTT